MNQNEKLAELRRRYEDSRQQGTHVSVDDLCRECPELRDRLLTLLDEANGLSSQTEWAPSLPKQETEFDDSFREALSAVVRPTIPGYEILDVLGRGGMGIVYKARQTSLNRLVALKLVGIAGGLAAVARFQAEARAIARLRHPNIVQIFETGDYHGQPYLCLEFVEGGSLADQLDGQPWGSDQAAAFVETLARAIHAVHQEGIIHRDLKPANILLQKNEGGKLKDETKGECNSSFILHPSCLQPLVTDFGLAKEFDQSSDQTKSGAVLGTPAYMAPEQALGHSKGLRPAADIYALGAVLYELLTGRPPFEGESVLETLELVKTQEPISPSRIHAGTPRSLEIICLKCLQKDPVKRYASAEELADDLQRFLNRQPIRGKVPGVLELARLWCVRVERMRDAGIFSIVLALVLTGWDVFLLAQVFSGYKSVDNRYVTLAAITGTILAFFVPLAVIGWGTIHRKLVAVVAGLVFSAGNLSVMLAYLAGFDLFVDNLITACCGLPVGSEARNLIGVLFLVMCAVLLIAYSIALSAWRENQGSGVFFRRGAKA